MKKIEELHSACAEGSWENLMRLLNDEDLRSNISTDLEEFYFYHQITEKLAENGYYHCLRKYLKMEKVGSVSGPGLRPGWMHRHTAVKVAAKAGQFECLKLLLNESAFGNSLLPGGRQSMTMRQYALITALHHGQADCVISLFNEGGLGDTLFLEDALVPTWRHYAVLTSIREKKKAVLIKLLKHPDFNQLNWPTKPEGWSIFHLVVSQCIDEGHYDVLKAVLAIEGVAQLPWVGMNREWNMLHYVVSVAASSGNRYLLDCILQDKDFDQLQFPGCGDTKTYLISQTIKLGKKAQLAFFLDKVDFIDEVWLGHGDSEWTLRHLAIVKAAEYGQYSLIKMILDHRGFGQARWIGLEAGWTVRHYAFAHVLRQGHFELIDTFLKEPGFADSIWPHQGEGWTMRHYAVFKLAEFGNEIGLRSCLDDNNFAGAPWPGEVSGWTMGHNAIREAARSGHAGCIISLLKSYEIANPDSKTPYGRSVRDYVLRQLIDYDQYECFKTLVIYFIREHKNGNSSGSAADCLKNDIVRHWENMQVKAPGILKDIVIKCTMQEEESCLEFFRSQGLLNSFDAAEFLVRSISHDKKCSMVFWRRQTSCLDESETSELKKSEELWRMLTTFFWAKDVVDRQVMSTLELKQFCQTVLIKFLSDLDIPATILEMFRDKSREELEANQVFVNYFLDHFCVYLSIEECMVLSALFEEKSFALGVEKLNLRLCQFAGDEASWRKAFEAISRPVYQWKWLTANLTLGQNDKRSLDRLKWRLDSISFEQLLNLLKIADVQPWRCGEQVLHNIIEIKKPSLSLSQVFQLLDIVSVPHLQSVANALENELVKRLKAFMAVSSSPEMEAWCEDYRGVLLILECAVNPRSFCSLEFKPVLDEMVKYRRDQLPSDYQSRCRFILNQLKGRYATWQLVKWQRQLRVYIQRIVDVISYQKSSVLMSYYESNIGSILKRISFYCSSAQLTALQEHLKPRPLLYEIIVEEKHRCCEQFMKEKRGGFRCGQLEVKIFKKDFFYYIYNGTDYRRCVQNIKCKQQQDAQCSRDITLQLSKNPALFIYKNNPRLKFFSANHVGKENWTTQSGTEFDPDKNGRRPLRVAPPNGVQSIDLRHKSLYELKLEYNKAVSMMLGRSV